MVTPEDSLLDDFVSVLSQSHRLQLDPLEKAWMRSSALGQAAAQRQLLAQESSLVLKKVTHSWPRPALTASAPCRQRRASVTPH